MCPHCENINLVEQFHSPKEYEITIEYIQMLINIQGFLLLEGNCPLGEHNRNGYWVDDIIYHIIECSECRQAFSCVVNTYRGDGGFTKGK